MNLFPKDRLIPAIAQKVIFWIRHQVLSVMADGCCFNMSPIARQCKLHEVNEAERRDEIGDRYETS